MFPLKMMELRTEKSNLDSNGLVLGRLGRP